MKVAVTRSWAREKYGSYRVSLEDEVDADLAYPEGLKMIRDRLDSLAYECLLAYDRYKALENGTDFERASDLPRRDGADQGRETADSPTPTSAGAGAGAGAEDPGVPPAKGPGSVTETQLEALHILTARSTQSSEVLRKALARLKVERVEQIGTDAAAALIGKLNRLGSEDKA